jgi:anion-transporting  ArsA/GET3 family ATPase
VSSEPIESLDGLLSSARVLVMAGPGGVGKTTSAAALGVRAAENHGRRVMVVTVDPARRLADALGMARLTEEPILVPVGRAGSRGSGTGRLWMLMVDMAKTWDELVVRHAPEPAVADALLANGLYRTLTRRFVQSHDYIALDHLITLGEDDRYDLVIVDTPPSDHAIDLLDAPARMIEFFESRLLRWLIVGARSGVAVGSRAGLGTVAARPFLAVAERLLGDDFLSRIGEFFALFSELRPAFVARAEAVQAKLVADGTHYVVVTNTDPLVAAATQDLVDALAERSLTPGLIIANRFPPTLELRGSVVTPRLTADDLERLEDSSLRAAVGQLLSHAERAKLPVTASGGGVLAVAWRAGELTDVDGLARLLEPAGREPGG